MKELPVVIIGAGMGGLSAALALASRGVEVTVLERGSQVGGKIRRIDVDNTSVDAGPTVFTLRGIFDEIFTEAGASLDDCVTLRRAEVLARHAWDDAAFLDCGATIKMRTQRQSS